MGRQLTPPPLQAAPTGDRASSVVGIGGSGQPAGTGTFTAVGPGAPFQVYGSFNFEIWGSVATALTTTAGSLSASVSSGTGISAGMTVVSANVPPGTTWGTFSGTSGTLALPQGGNAAGVAWTSASVLGGTDNAAVFVSVAVAATVQLERCFDGGKTWLICGVGGAGQQAIYTNPQSISISTNEPEQGVAYRLNCTAYTSGTINYRFSGTGLAQSAFGPID